MHVRCPNCNATMESMDPVSKEGVLCVSCGEKFSLINDGTVTSRPRRSQMIGHFRLLEVVGQGAFGVVWRALDTELDRIVAVKTPRNGVIEAEDANQFIREARAAAQLKHANIVSVHEVGRFEDFLYIVSDFIDGETLSSWLRDNRPNCRESAEMCATITDALEHAHQHGVIHRDMKPGNILLDSLGSPNIADFGLALRQVGDMTVTFDGQIMGTPSYMSPEQATGASVDCRSDVYAMGVILFQMMTGEKPFRGNHRMVLQQVLDEEAPSPRRLNGSIPRDLETICLKCLEKSPGRRYQTAAELGDDLRRYLNGEPIRARPIRVIERMWKWSARRPLVASLLTGFLLAVLCGLLGVTWQWRNVVASQRHHAMTQLELIRSANPSTVESAIYGLREFRQWADPKLSELAADESLPATDRFRCHLALIEREPQRTTYVVNELLRVSPPDVLDFDELALGTHLLTRVEAVPESRLVELAMDPSRPDALRFRALFILASTIDSRNSELQMPWEALTRFAVGRLVAEATTSPSHYRTLLKAFRPVHLTLLPAFREFLADENPTLNERFTAAAMIGDYAADQPEFLCDLLLSIRPEQYAVILASLQKHREFVNNRFSKRLNEQPGSFAGQDEQEEALARQAVAAVTLLHLHDQPSGVWPLFRQSPNMKLRTRLIHLCAELQLPPRKLIAQLQTESDVSVRRAILLALGEYGDQEDSFRNELRPHLEDMYRHDPDAGIHSAVAWLLRSWGRDNSLRQMDAEPTFVGPIRDRQWYVNSQGMTMVVIDHPPVFMMGAPEGEPLRSEFDRQHLRQVDRKFAISATEVTWQQFQKFVDDDPSGNHSHPHHYGPDRDGPVLAVSWVQAAKYCRWLSEQEDIPEDQMCFPKREEISDTMSFPDDLMERTGYRLPSEGEWECACRAGTVTSRFFGDTGEYLDKYGWHIGNSMDYAWRVGLLKPNDYGLFDMYGNAWEWCLDRHGSLPKRGPADVFFDAPKLVGTKPRMLRGGSMNTRTEALRSAQRDFLEAKHNRNHNVGLRIVRTLPD